MAPSTTPLVLSGREAYIRESEVFGPISSTNTNRLASSPLATISFQAAFNHWAHPTTPIVHFLAEAESLPQPPEGEVAKGRADYVL